MNAVISGPNALSSEYHGVYGRAGRDLGGADIMDHSDVFRPDCVFGPGFREKVEDLSFIETRVLLENGTYSPVIGDD